MSDFPRSGVPVLPLHVHAAGRGRQRELLGTANLAYAGANPQNWVANLIAYMPVALPWDYPVNRVFWMNGSTNTTTNVQFGIYTADGTRLYTTGTQVMGTVSVGQYVTPSPTFVLPTGRYYFAWTCDNTTNRGSAHPGTALAGTMWGLLEETPGSFGLPATMASAIRWTRAWGYSVCGVTRTTTGF